MTLVEHETDARIAAVAGRFTDLNDALRHRAAATPGARFLRFVSYDTHPHGITHDLSYAETERQVQQVAAVLTTIGVPGDRVAILVPQSNEFIIGFLAAQRAGRIAVPLFSPDLPGHGDRLTAVLADCDPTVVLATSSNAEQVRAFAGPRRIVVVDDLPTVPTAWSAPPVQPGAVAYLQYTSGSTRVPAGVRITHRNIVANSAQTAVHTGADSDTTIVSWLPLFHDMGLVSTVGTSLIGGATSVFMDPVAFLMRPQRWLEHLSAVGRSATSAPNFAFDFCAKRIPARERAALDLSRVAIMINGAEPVSSGTLDRFQDAFAGAGLRPGVVSPSYGLAEATLFVASAPVDDRSRVRRCDAAALSLGEVQPVRDGEPAAELILCGYGPGSTIAVVDPVSGQRCADGRVGEIWVHGDSVGDGYWNRPQESAQVFGAALGNPGELPWTGWLRTGDLGVLVEGSLAVTGRIKDVIIVDGRNHYPQDVERTAEDAHEVIGRHRCAAIRAGSDAGERAVLVAEVSRHFADGGWDRDEVSRTVVRAVSRQHGLALHAVVLVAPDTIPRTTSGKIARAATARAYLDGGLSLWTGTPA